VRLPGAEAISVLAMPCASRDEFERHLSSVADIVKLLDVSDDLLPKVDKLPDKSHTLARLELLFGSRLDEDDAAPVLRATRVLRTVNALRVGAQHSAAKAERTRAADTLGVPLDGRWGEAWDRVRALVAHALRDVGDGARRVADRH
jgi:hypothetical protein